MPERSAAADFNRKFSSKDTPFPAGVSLFLEKLFVGLKREGPA